MDSGCIKELMEHLILYIIKLKHIMTDGDRGLNLRQVVFNYVNNYTSMV